MAEAYLGRPRLSRRLDDLMVNAGMELLALAHLRVRIRQRLELRDAGGPGSGRYPKGSGTSHDEMHAPAKSTAQVNKILKEHGYEETLVKGSGYLYFDGGDTSSWFSSSVSVPRVSSLSPQRWIDERNELAVDKRNSDEVLAREAARIKLRGLGGPGSGRYPKGSGKAYHGTVKAHLDSIVKNGLQASYSGVVWPDLSKKGYVYVTPNLDDAMSWARETAERSQLFGPDNTRPVVLEVEIPESELSRLKVDDHFDIGGLETGYDNKQFQGDIKPEWIKHAYMDDMPHSYGKHARGPMLKVFEQTYTFYIPFALKIDEPRTLVGGPGSGNFGHVGRPGEVGGSAAENNAVMDAKLAAESETGMAAVEKLLDRAVAEADYKAGEATEWDQLSQNAQDQAYNNWEQDAQENLQSNDDGSIYNEVKKEQVDEIHSDDAFDEKIYEKVKAQLAESGLKLGDENFDTKPTIPDHYSESETGHPELIVDGIKHADGTALTNDEKITIQEKWNSIYEDHFQKELDSRMQDKQDHIWELESESQMEQLSHEWGNMSDEEKFGIAKNTDGINTWAQTYKPGLPDKWVTGVESQSNSDEDYARTHAIALKLTELRTDEIRQERGLVGKDREYEIKEQVKDPSYTGPKHYSIINKSTGEVIGASNSVEQAEVNARAWASEGVSTPAMIENVWSEWKGSSTSPMGLALQLATANELGGVHRMTDDEVTMANNAANFHGGMPTVQAYVRAQWEVTQTIMHKAGEESTGVYRGLMLPGESLKSTAVEYYNKLGEQLHPTGIKLINALPNQPTSDTNPKMVNFSFNGNEYTVKQERQTQYVTDIRDINPQDYETPQQTINRKIESLSRISTGGVYAKLPDLALKRAGAQSTTGTASVANDWMGVGHLPPDAQRVVLRVNAPRTSVLSLPVYGQNSQEEHEVVLAGTRDRWSWDVWKFKAPHFSSQPITHKKLKAASSRMLVAKMLIDLQDIDRGQPHWLTDIPDSVVIRARERRLKALGAVGSGNFGHAGRPGEIGGSGKGAKSFTSDEGYAWHEQGPVLDWATNLSYDDQRALNTYSGFGYSDVNNYLRGTYTPPIVNQFVRAATPEEQAYAKTRQPQEIVDKYGISFGKDVKHFDPNDPTEAAYDESGNLIGRIVHNIYYRPVEGGDVMEWSVQRAAPDQARVEQIQKEAGRLNDLIANRGYVLPEAVELKRAAYFPGISPDDFADRELRSQIFEEKGFTSTMLGDAGGRLDGYVASGKWESIYKRSGGRDGSLVKGQDEVGTAARITIDVPAGTRVAPIEAARRLDYDYPRVQDPEVFNHPEWTADGNLKPSDFTIRDYTQKPTVRTDRLRDKNTRSESEVLLGSGAQYKIKSVRFSHFYHGSDDSLKPVKIYDIHLEYIGGGSSAGVRP